METHAPHRVGGPLEPGKMPPIHISFPSDLPKAFCGGWDLLELGVGRALLSLRSLPCSERERDASEMGNWDRKGRGLGPKASPGQALSFVTLVLLLPSANSP